MKTIQEIAYHRNGVMGNGFYVIKFRQDRQNMLAVVFGEMGNVAVFDLDLLGKGNITFGENSWRGDNFEDWLRKEIANYEDELIGKEI